MKIDVMFAKASDHAKLARVIERMLRIDCAGWTWKATPRRLLAGLYVHYRNALLRVKELQRCIQQHGDYARKLEARIKQLEDYEKQVKYAGYRAEVICYHWSCGDGCCSDSWYGYKIYNQHGICERELDSDRYACHTNSYSAECSIRQQYGSAIPISHDDNYDGEKHGDEREDF